MLISEFSHLKMGQISGCLSHIKKSNNCLQPIFEALINSVESYLEEIDREIKIVFSVQKTDSEIGDINVQIIDNGDGFDLTDPNYPTFGRFGKWYDNSKGQNNKGCGRAQFFHYFNEVEIISKGFDANKNYKRIHWKASKENDLYVVDDKKTDIPKTTTIHLQNYIQDEKEFYLKIADLNKLKNEIITSCFLKLLNKKFRIALELKENGKSSNNISITSEDLERYKKNSQEETIEVKYQIYKIKKDHNNKDISEFGDCDDCKSEKFKMNIYKLPTNFENHVYLCANDVAVKDILQSDKIFDKSITIDGKNNTKNKLLILIKDADGYSFLNDNSNGERDDFDKIPRQQDIEKDIRNNGFKTLEIDYSKIPILFYDDLVDNAEKKIIEVIPAIQKDNLEIQEILQIAKEYIKTHNLSEEQAHKVL